MGLNIFKSKFSSLSHDFDLRLDSKFYSKINEDDFKVINKSQYPFIELRHILFPSYEDFDYKEDEVYKSLSTNAENFDEEGNILNYGEVNKENHPDRIKYKVKEKDIVISSLKGAKVSAIFIDKDKTDYEWSNGFYIFKNQHQKFRTLYLYYLLRSRLFKAILDDNLSRGIGISVYYDRDLLRLKIPLVPETIQDETIESIVKIESEISKIKKSMPNTQEVIERVLEEELSCFYNQELIDKRKTQVFSKKTSEISRRKFLRLDPKYYVFWDKTKGKLFESEKINCVKLGRIIKLTKDKILKKGDLDKEYILIDKEDVDSKNGIIVNENQVDKIDSDKILFGEADILIPKLRPYLGGTFLNQKEKDLIGTPEFLPYSVDGNKLLKEYLKYILLSKDFLNLVSYLSSGKEHPRISSYDLESIEIPLPISDEKLTKQKRVIDIIEKRLGDLNEKRKLIENHRMKIENMIHQSLK